MKIKEFLKVLSPATRYIIKLTDTPHNIAYWGAGGRITNTLYDEEIIKSIAWTKRGVTIYI